MTVQIAIVFGILIATIVLFVSEKLRLDVVALLSLLALTLTGILGPEEAVAGFADPLVLMIAGLFVVGDGLFKTGVAQAMGKWPARLAGNSETKLIAVIMVLVAGLSGVMSSTGTVAVMLPVVMGLAFSRKISPSKLLIPVSVASLLGGMLTLIGTPPNIVVSRHLENMEQEPFGFFTFTPIGLAVVVVGILFMVLIGRHLLPDRPSPSVRPDGEGALSSKELAATYELSSSLFRVRLPKESPLVGKTLAEADLSNRFGLAVVELKEPQEAMALGTGGWRKDRSLRAVHAVAATRLEADNMMVLQGNADAITRLVAEEQVTLLEDQREGEDEDVIGPGIGIAEVLLTPRSKLIGKTIKELSFRDRFQVSVVGVKRLGQLEKGDLRDIALRFGDTLLVKGPWKKIRLLEKETRDLIVALPPEQARADQPAYRAPMAVATMLGMMALLTFGTVPPVTAVLLAAVAMVLFKCLSVEDAYRAINWQSVILIAGILPMATALDKTGGMDLIVSSMARALDGSGPLLLLAALFVLTSLLSQVISNTATAVLIAPIAYQLAIGIGAAPEPFMMTIALAASTAFATPVASPVNTLVLGPGGYRFGDFFKVGITLQVVVLGLVLVLVPLLFPF